MRKDKLCVREASTNLETISVNNCIWFPLEGVRCPGFVKKHLYADISTEKVIKGLQTKNDKVMFLTTIYGSNWIF